MGGIPFNHSRVTDGIIRALRYSGVFGSNNTAQTLRELDNNLTDAEIDAIVATLDYGAASAGRLTSLDDIYVMVDSDNQPATQHTNFMRITRGMDTPPISDPRKQLATIYFNSLYDTSSSVVSEMVVGPDTTKLSDTGVNNTYATGKLFLGGYRDIAGNTGGYSVVDAGPTALDGIAPGLQIRSKFKMELRGDPAVEFWYDDRDIKNGGFSGIIFGSSWQLGGFRKYNADSLMFIGEYSGASNTEALLIAKNGDNYETVLNSSLGGRVIRFRTENAAYDMGVEINAVVGGAGGGRSRSANMNPKLVVYSDNVNGAVDDAVVAIRGLINDYAGNLLLIRNDDIEYVAQKSQFILCQTENPIFPGLWVNRFVVYNNGDVCASGDINAGGAVNPGSGACDVAEWIQVPDGCESGDVIIIDTDGIYKKSTEVADTKVVGVIAESPGVNLGKDATVENQYPLAVCGLVHTSCTTANGAIAPGNLLVSGSLGKAQKAGDSPAAGTILGKALSSLEQSGEEIATGLVKMLAILQ